jgi:hypothetical protein
MNLIGIRDSSIENNFIDSPICATVIARPNDNADRQAILLRHSARVQLRGNTLHDPAHHTKSDATSGSPLVGLEAAQDITLDGTKLNDTSERNLKTK